MLIENSYMWGVYLHLQRVGYSNILVYRYLLSLKFWNKVCLGMLVVVELKSNYVAAFSVYFSSKDCFENSTKLSIVSAGADRPFPVYFYSEKQKKRERAARSSRTMLWMMYIYIYIFKKKKIKITTVFIKWNSDFVIYF